MQFLVPLLVKMASTLRNFVPMHDIQNLISDPLPIPRAFTYHSHHLSE